MNKGINSKEKPGVFKKRCPDLKLPVIGGSLTGTAVFRHFIKRNGTAIGKMPTAQEIE